LSPVVDVHLEMSRLFFGDTDHREQAKTITHGLNYGRGVASIAEQVRRPPADVEAMIDRYRQQCPEVAGWQAQQRTWAERGQLLASGTGRHIGSDPDRAHTTAPARVAQACAGTWRSLGCWQSLSGPQQAQDLAGQTSTGSPPGSAA